MIPQAMFGGNQLNYCNCLPALTPLHGASPRPTCPCQGESHSERGERMRGIRLFRATKICPIWRVPSLTPAGRERVRGRAGRFPSPTRFGAGGHLRHFALAIADFPSLFPSPEQVNCHVHPFSFAWCFPPSFPGRLWPCHTGGHDDVFGFRFGLWLSPT